MRINQIARKYELENKAILEYLDSIGVPGKSHSSSIDESTIDLLLQHFGKLEPKESEKPKTRSKFAKIRRPKGYKPSPKEPPKEEEAPKALTAKAGEAPEAEPAIEEPAPDQGVVEKPLVAEKKPKTTKAETQAKTKAPTKKKTKKEKPKTLTLDQIRSSVAETEPEIIVEAEIDETSLKEDEATVPFGEEPKPEKEPVRHDEDEAIRREIQKLKKKQKQTIKPEGTEIKPPADKAEPGKAGRRRVPKPTKSRRGKQAWKREKRERREQQMAAEAEKQEREKTTLKIHDATTVADVANGLGVSPSELIQKLISMGVMVSINQPLEFDVIQIIADDYGYQVEKVDLFDKDVFAHLWEEDTQEERMEPRSPVVTIMGHVDHGKTKLLDAVRQTDIVSQEAGGITQHIGAYHVKTPGGVIVFLDTPGHEAFTAMRARGAMVTDIVVLVVAATDGVMPQTIEAINHAKAANVPIIVAINKIDVESANPDRVKQQLAEHGLTAEDWGGDTVMVPISALQKTGIDNLLEAILLQAEMLELKADPHCRARGTIIEGRLEQGRGPVASVLIQQGTLRLSEPFVTGVYSGRIRAMQNDRHDSLTEAGPSTPVEILGIEDVPSAGDPFIVVEDDNQAKLISAKLQQIQRERELRRTRHITLEDLHSQIEEGKIKELRVIVKGDVQGSVGALSESLLKIESDKVRIEIIHSGVGAISESDVMLASASNAIILGFNVRPHPHVMELAKREHVDISTYRVIYQAIADIKNAMEGLLDKTFQEKVLGRGEVREVFRLSRGLSIAGLFIQDGRLLRNAPVRLLRDSVVVHEGNLSSLRRFKEDVKEVPSGYECGIGLENFNDIRDGDVIECYQLEEVAPTL